MHALTWLFCQMIQARSCNYSAPHRFEPTGYTMTGLLNTGTGRGFGQIVFLAVNWSAYNQDE